MREIRVESRKQSHVGYVGALAFSAMVAVLGLSDRKCSEVCVLDEFGVPTNYNRHAPLIIAETQKGIVLACKARKPAVVRQGAMPRPLSDAFHSSLMKLAQKQWARARAQIKFQHGICPIYIKTLMLHLLQRLR